MARLIKCLLLFSFLLLTVYGQNEESGWNNIKSLPLIRVYKLSLPSNGLFNGSIDGSVQFIDSTFVNKVVSPLHNDSLAANCTDNFIKNNLVVDGDLELAEIIHSSNGKEEIKSEADSGHTIIYEVFYKSIKLNHYYGYFYLSGHNIREAYFKLPGKIEPISESVREIIPKEKAISVFKEEAEKAFKEKYEVENIELVYNWYILDNIQYGLDFNKPVLRPNWLITFGGGSEILVDAFDGKLWRDD